jgi:hypothetical protein
MRWISRIAISLMLLAVVGPAPAGTEDEVKALFAKFLAAQNAHDLKAVGELLQDSPQFLWITRGTPIWGRDAALKRFEALYQGTWSLDPKIDELRGYRVAAGRRAALRADNVHDLPRWPDCAANALPNEPTGSKDCHRMEGIEHPSNPSTAAISYVTAGF